MSSSPAVELSRSHRLLDEAIRAIPASWFRPVRAVYWTDLLASSAVGWTAFIIAVRAPGVARAALLLISVLALYRAALFIHEITHRSTRELPGFAAAWNALVGVPLLMPSFLYEGVHLDHHRARTYGTAADPEYVPFGRRSTILMILFALGSTLAPVVFVARFAIVAPLTWVVPPLRRLVAERFSSLVINHAYVRRAPIGASGRVQEAAACLFVWTILALLGAGRLSPRAVVLWLATAAAAFGLNAFRTLAAHRYGVDDEELSTTGQLLDSCTIDSDDAGRQRLMIRSLGGIHALVAPVGLRFHALHHWIPSLPYHRLGAAHRVLASTMRRDAPYHATIEHGFVATLRDLHRRATAHARGRDQGRRERV